MENSTTEALTHLSAIIKTQTAALEALMTRLERVEARLDNIDSQMNGEA